MKAEILTILKNNKPDVAKKLIKAVLKPTVDYTPIAANKEQLAEVVEGAGKLSKEALVALVKAMHQQMNKA